MSAAGRKFDAQANKIRAGMTRVENGFKNAGAKLANLQTGLASLGAGVFLKGALEESMQFQRSLNMTKAVTGSTVEQMEMMRAKALEWGAQTQFSSVQVAGAMAELGKMGNKTNEIISLMPGTMALAAAGEIEMAQAANYTMGILNQFGMELDNAGTVADVLAKGASMAATSVDGIASAMSNTGLQAQMAGLTIQDTTAALAAMASKNLEGAEAGTMMMNTLKALQVMPDKVREGFEGMGINIDNFRDSTTGQMTDFWGLIEAMKEAGATGAQLGEMFDVRAMKGMAVLVGTSTEQLNEYRESLSDTVGASQEMADTLQEGLKPMIQFESMMQNLKVIVGTFAAEALLPVLTKFNIWFGNLQKNNPQLLKMATYVLMGVTALGAILIPLGLMLSTIGTLISIIKTLTFVTKIWTAIQWLLNGALSANPIALIILGVIALTTAIILAVKYWNQITSAVKTAWDWLWKMYDSFQAIILIFNPFAIGIITVINVIKSLITSWGEITSAFREGGFIAGIKAIGIAILEGIVKPFESALLIGNKFLGLIGGVAGKVKSFFTGGETEATSPYSARSPEAPMPYSTAQNATAEASVKVYTEEGMGVKPFESGGNLGYNMQGSYAR